MRSTNEVHNSIGNDNYIKSLLEFMHDRSPPTKVISWPNKPGPTILNTGLELLITSNSHY